METVKQTVLDRRALETAEAIRRYLERYPNPEERSIREYMMLSNTSLRVREAYGQRGVIA